MDFDQLKRRDFLPLLGGAAAWPLTVRAQQPYQIRRMGVLMGNAENDETQSWIAALREELGKLGWTEGRNIQVDIRWAASDVASMKRFAKELVALQPDVILTQSTPAAGAMLEQTHTIPVVFLLVADPVGSGYVVSLPRPGGNATGFSPIVGSLGGKWVELLKEIAPRVARVTLLSNPPTATFIQGYLGPSKLPPRLSARRRFSHPLTTCRPSNRSSTQRRASQVVASSCCRTPL
jgi:putative ABC transport system substrate-binding protein